MAADGTIDWLAIEVSGDASRASNGIDALVASLERLDKALSSPAKKLGQVSRALRQLKTDAAGVNLSNIKINASAAKNLSAIAQATKGIDEGAASRLRSISGALGSFSGVNGKGIGTAVTQLRKLPAVFEEYSKMDIPGFVSQLNALNPPLAKLAHNVARLSAGVNSLPRSLRTAGAAARSVAASNKYMNLQFEQSSGDIGRLTLKTTGLLAASQGLFMGLGYLIDQSTRYVEDMNLFEASMGDATQAATEFGQKCQDLMGIDFGELARNQGVFETLITGMGETKEHADVMSQQLTQLGYDIASFFNISTEDAMLKIQSGIAGELEPLRRIGWDLSDARMQLEATNLGISESTQQMTQAEKVALRYYMIMNQVTIVHGDMARTIASPANQLRVLKMQLQLCARTVGNLFIPALNAILPVAIAVVKAITMIAQAIAGLFGIDATFEVDYSGLDTSGIASGADDAADAIDDVGDSASGTNKKLKDLKNTVMGFDELNKLNDNSDDTGSGSGGSGSGGVGAGAAGLDIPLDTYDFFQGLSDKMNDAATQLAKKMVDALKVIAPIAAGIGAAFLAWKIAPGLLKDLGKAKEIMELIRGGKGLAGIAGLLGGLASPAAAVAAVVGLLVTHFANLAINSENFRRGCKAVFDFIVGMGGAAMDVLSSVAGSFNFDFGPLLGGLGDIGEAVNDVFDLQWSDAIMIAVAGLAMLIPGVGEVVAGVVAVGEVISLGLRAVGYAVSPVSEQVDALGGVSEETASRFGTSLDSMTDAFGILAKCSFPDAVVTDDDVATVESKIKDVHDTLVNNLDAKRNEELANIDLLAGLMPEEEIQAAKDRVNAFYDDQISGANQQQTELLNIYKEAAENGGQMSESSAARLKEIQEQLQEELIQSSGATADEINSITENMANNNRDAALQEASDVIQAAIEKRDEQVQAAWDTYDGQMQALDGMLSAGEITREEYDNVSQAALQAAQDQQDAANNAYYGENGVLANVRNGLGDAADQLDTDTGEIKEKWQVWCDDLGAKAQEFADGAAKTFSDFGENAGKNWDDFTDGLHNAWLQFTDETSAGATQFAEDTKRTLKDLGDGATQNWNSFTNGIGSLWNTATTSVGSVAGGFASDMVSKLQGLGRDASSHWNGFTSDLSGAWSGAIGTIGSWYDNRMAPLFGYLRSAAANAGSYVYQALSNPVSWITGSWANLSNWFWNNVVNPIVNAFWTIPNNIRNAMNWIIGRLNGFRINLPGIVQQVTGWSSIGFSIPYLANGGFVDEGQLFVARERGPEMVGTMGGRTAVANNDQIVAGIERGVINAMVQVMGASQQGDNADTQVTFVVGSEELARTVVKGMRTLDARGEINVSFA